MPDASRSPLAPPTRTGSLLLVVGVQDRLFPAMDADHREEVVKNIKILGAAARRLGIARLAAEQYPKGLGHTLPEVRESLGADTEIIAKVAFSCWAAEPVRAKLTAAAPSHVIVAGIEAHVDVLMTAFDLLGAGHAVHVVADAVTSRTQANWRLAMDQLRQAGANVTSTETVVFQLLGQADTEEFRELSRLLR